MPRYIREEPINKPADFVEYMMHDYFTKHEFSPRMYKNNESVWQHGTGTLTAPRFLTYWYQNGIIHIEAWVPKFTWFPGVFSGENELKGFYGSVIKNDFRKSLDELIYLLYQPLPTDQPGAQEVPGMAQGGFNPQQPGGPAPGQGPVFVQGVDTSRFATPSLVLGILSLPVGLFIPILGLVLAAVGMSYGRKARNSVKAGAGKAGYILSVIGIVLAIIIWILNIILNVSSLM